MEKVWNMNPWPRTTTFNWLFLNIRILTRDNLRKRGMQGPTQCPLCLHEEEKMNHLMDQFPFSSALWDRGPSVFLKSDRAHGQPDQTLKEWN